MSSHTGCLWWGHKDGEREELRVLYKGSDHDLFKEELVQLQLDQDVLNLDHTQQQVMFPPSSAMS